MSEPVITFVSDYGLADEFVGVCHGVIARICPEARIIDLAHGIPRHDVRAGALVLAGALPYLPTGVHLAVVDPGVGTNRRAVALALADGRRLVGPDNGLLSLAAQQGGGVAQAVDIGASPVRLEPVSATFHGRDIFAPVAAHLAAGRPVAELGSPLDRDQLVQLELPAARLDPGGAIRAQVVHVDRFGNLTLNVAHEQLAGSGLKLGHAARLIVSGREPIRLSVLRTFAEAAPGAPLLYEDSGRRLALAVSHGDAAARFGLRPGDELRIEPA